MSTEKFTPEVTNRVQIMRTMLNAKVPDKGELTYSEGLAGAYANSQGWEPEMIIIAYSTVASTIEKMAKKEDYTIPADPGQLCTDLLEQMKAAAKEASRAAVRRK